MGLAKGLATAILGRELAARLNAREGSSQCNNSNDDPSSSVEASTGASASATVGSTLDRRTQSCSSLRSFLRRSSLAAEAAAAEADAAEDAAAPPVSALGLFRPREWKDAKRAKTLVCDLSEMMYGFPRLAHEWLDEHCVGSRDKDDDDEDAEEEEEDATKTEDEKKEEGEDDGKKRLKKKDDDDDGDGEGTKRPQKWRCGQKRVVRGKTKLELATKCLDADLPVGVVKKTTDGGRVETTIRLFSVGVLSSWLEDELVVGFPGRDLCRGVFENLRRIYYVIDGKGRPKAKQSTAAKRR